MDIDQFNLNLLRLFDAIYTHRKISGAAEALGISQPAASQGLARMRELLEDPLFVRAPRGVAPTPRAQRMSGVVRHALESIGRVLTDTHEFDPATTVRRFRIHMMSDMGEDRYLPDLLAQIESKAPGITLETVTLPHEQLTEAMENASIDFAFGYLLDLRGCSRQPLFDDHYVLLMKRDRSADLQPQNGRITVDQIKTLEFVVVHTYMDTLRMLRLLGVETHIRLVAQHFLALPNILRATNLCTVLPRSTAERFNQHGEFLVLEVEDLPLRNLTVSLYWNRRFEADPAVLWFRQLASDLYAQTSYRVQLS